MKIQTPELTVHTAHTVVQAVVAAMKAGDHVLDFSGVSRVDSAAVAVFLAAKRHCPPSKNIQILSAPDALQRLIASYGLQSLFEQVEFRHSA